MRQRNPVDPIEVEQAKLYDEIPDDATVTQAVAMMLGLDAGDNTEHLIVRQLMEADRHVDRYAKVMKSVRRAAAGVGFNAGVSFAVGAMRAAKVARQEAETDHEMDDDELSALLPPLAKAIDECTPERVGFGLFLFEWIEDGGMWWVSNARRDTMVKALQEWVRKQKEKGH